MLGRYKSLEIQIKGLKLESVKSVKLLGLAIDHNLSFDPHPEAGWCKN